MKKLRPLSHYELTNINGGESGWYYLGRFAAAVKYYTVDIWFEPHTTAIYIDNNL